MATGDWTIVAGRRRRHCRGWAGDHQLRDPQPVSVPSAPSPWTPLDPVVDPDRQSKLLRRIQSTTEKLERSRFYHCFLYGLRSPMVRDGIASAIASATELRLVVYGVGSIESYDPPRLQLALALLLRRDLGLAAAVAPVEVFDPVLSATECAVVAALGCRVLPIDEKGQREVDVPTLFFMPHCEAMLYDALLSANWLPSRLKQVVVLGNSFTAYAQYVEDGAGLCGSAAVKEAAQHVLGVMRYVREVDIEAKSEADDEADMFKAFHTTSWHFFELRDDSELALGRT